MSTPGNQPIQFNRPNRTHNTQPRSFTPERPATSPPAAKPQATPQASPQEQVHEGTGRGPAKWKQRPNESCTPKEILELLARYQARIQELIPPQVTLTAARLIRRIEVQLRRNRELGLCTPSSVVTTVGAAAAMGLDICDGQVSVRINCARHESEIVFRYASPIVAYPGLLLIAARNGFAISAQAVHEHDQFEFGHEGDQYHVHWRRALDQKGKLIGAFAKFSDKASGHMVHVEFMDAQQIDQVAGDPKYRSATWSAWPTELWRKSPIRRGFKMLPALSDSLKVAIQVTQQDETGEPLDDLLDLYPEAHPEDGDDLT